MNSRHALYASSSQRSSMNFLFSSPSDRIVCVIAFTIATFVPGRSGRWKSASTCAERTRSIARGSTTISFAPSRRRRFICDANTGCASVGFAPITMIASDFITESNACVPADSPSVALSP